ncbi:MAG: cytochrome c peroxidase [Gemmatimonadaceae bacterium]
MLSFRARVAMLALCGAVSACGGDPSGGVAPPPTTSPAPTLRDANPTAAAIVGSAITYDATKAGNTFSDPGRTGLTYSITFSAPVPGLTTSGGTIRGTPTTPGVALATITATDALGRTATDRFGLVVFDSGLTTPILPAPPLAYSDALVPLPAHFLASVGGTSVASLDNTPLNNQITDAGATLGRVLFYDTRLSANDAISCASCHRPSIGFGDTPARSVGFTGVLTPRHSTGLVNARFYKRGRFFWDERAATLEAQALDPIQNPAEMGMTLDALALKLIATPYYQPLFTAAFGTPGITSERVAAALAQYTRSLVSTGSRYDRAFSPTGVPDFASTLSAQEQQGEQLFQSVGCAGCHVSVAQVGDSVHNTGLDATITDVGAVGGAFKTPSLRNVAVRPRFMHDGRFTALEQVVSFYDSGVQPNPGLDPRLKAPDGGPRRLGLSAAQRSAIVAFLGSLTDSTFLTAARFSNPFAPPGTPTPPTGASVTIQANAFRPASLTVARGTTITFTNLDNDRHSAEFDDKAITSTAVFVSGSRIATMPSVIGIYFYHCSVHPATMTGTITVQ